MFETFKRFSQDLLLQGSKGTSAHTQEAAHTDEDPDAAAAAPGTAPMPAVTAPPITAPPNPAPPMHAARHAAYVIGPLDASETTRRKMNAYLSHEPDFE